MTSGARLSVVLPVRDGAPYIGAALTSLQRNVGTEDEVIVVDDGSIDATVRLVGEFQSRLPGLRVLRHPHPVGLADARNAGLAAATGRLITYLDADDWLAPGYLPSLVQAIDTLDCDFVRADHVQVKGRTRVVHRAPEARRDVVLSPRSGIMPALRRTMVDYPYAWAGIYKSDIRDLLHFPGNLHTAEDRPWIWRLHREAKSYAVVSLAGLFYRRLVSTSLTQIGDARQLQFLDAFEMVLDQALDDREVLPKAGRQLLAILAHHLALTARFTEDLRAELDERGRALVAKVPADVLLQIMPDDARSKLLRPMLPPGVGRVPHRWRPSVRRRPVP